MPDQTKTRGLQLALNSLESAQKLLETMVSNDPYRRIEISLTGIDLAVHMVRDEIEHVQSRPYVGDERREKE